MRGSPSAGISLAADEAAAGNVGQGGGLAVAQRNVNVLTLAGLAAAQERRHDAVAGVQAGREIGHGDADLDWGPVAGAGDVHETKFGLDHDVVAGTVGVGPGLTVAGDGGVDEAGVDFAQRFVIHAVLFQGAGQVVFHENVALGGELVQDLDAFLVLEGQAERFFVAVYLDTGVY